MSHLKTIIILLTTTLSTFSFAQTWTFEKEENGVKGYVAKTATIYSFKGEITVNASLSACLAVLRDVPGQRKWIAGTVQSKQLSFRNTSATQNELYTYNETYFPWPMSNRDIVVRYITTQNPSTKVISIIGSNQAKHIPEVKGLVRFKTYSSTVAITPISKNKTKMELVYNIGSSDLPTWFVDSFAKGQFYKDIASLSKLPTQAPYKDTVIEGITNME